MWQNDLVMQFLTAPFPQMLIASIATLVISYVLLTLTNIRDPSIRGFFHGLTLIAPIIVYLLYTPSIWMMNPMIERSYTEGGSFIISQVSPAVEKSIVGYAGAPPTFSTVFIGEEVARLSYTGILCIRGLVFGAATLTVSYLFGVRIVKRCQGVMDVSPEDEPRLYKSVDKLAQRVGVPAPKIGLTESLQPNAFTIGYGDNAMIVFSSGLVAALNQVELEAVIAHELAHIRNRDFHLMAIVSSLRVVSFFNPAAYLSASMFAREREYLADDVGSRATGRRSTLKRALTKIASIQAPRRRAFIPELVSGLFIYSQIGSLKAAFTSHPSLDMRLNRIGSDRSGSVTDIYKALLVALLLLGSMALLSSYIMQPMRLFDTFLRFDAVANMPLSGVMFTRGQWIGGMNTFTFTFKPLSEIAVRELPDVLGLGKLVVH
jgi:heat shock protein HtpX